MPVFGIRDDNGATGTGTGTGPYGRGRFSSSSQTPHTVGGFTMGSNQSPSAASGSMFRMTTPHNYNNMTTPSQSMLSMASPPGPGTASSSMTPTPAMFQSPLSSSTTTNDFHTGIGGRISNTATASLSSVRLCCLSGDGRTMHSLNIKDNTIESQQLQQTQPGGGRGGGENLATRGNVKDAVPLVVRTPLPEDIRRALEVDPPLEMFSVDGDGSSLASSRIERKRKVVRWNLCLYTQKSLYVLDLSFDKENVVPDDGDSHGIGNATSRTRAVTGKVDAVAEPFERIMFGSWGTTIVRARPAPSQQHQQNGFATSMICPPKSIAVLTYNQDCSEYSLILSHNNRKNPEQDEQQLTTPLVFGAEQLTGDDSMERVVDFCFAQSQSLSLLSAMSVLLLKASSDILAASPIVFDGSVIPRSVLQEAMDYLEEELSTLPRSTAKWRQYRVARQYLIDVFGGSNGGGGGGGLFATARVLPEHACPPSASWKVQTQGPVLFASSISSSTTTTLQERREEQYPSTAVVLENFGRSLFVGIAVGKKNVVGSGDSGVDFAVISPTAVLPRYKLETSNDTYELDDALFRLSSWVEHVRFQGSESSSSSLRRENPFVLQLVVDPIDTLLHYVTPKWLATVSTNAIQVTSHRLHGKRANDVQTSAWSSLVVTGSPQQQLQGVVVVDDCLTISNESELLARLIDGSLIPINITETQIRHQVQEALLQQASRRQGEQPSPLRLTSGGSGTTASQQVLESLEGTKPLCELMEPLIRQIQSGLSGMSKVVGTSTDCKDITPDQLAVALNLYEKCDNEVVMPLLELKRVVKARRERLKDVIKSQLKQVNELRNSVKNLTEGISKIEENLERIEGNTAVQSQRSAAALLASQSLVPNISQAECEYFKDVKRLEHKTTKLEEKGKLLVESVKKTQSKLNGRPLALSLKPHEERAAASMLDDQAITIKEFQKKIDKSQKHLADLTKSLNL